MKNVKKKNFFVKMDKIMKKNDFVFFFQYNHLKNKDILNFKNNFYFFKQNMLLKNNNVCFFENNNMFICNNNYLYQYFTQKKINNLLFPDNLLNNDEILTVNQKKKKNCFFNQGPTFVFFFNNIKLLSFFFDKQTVDSTLRVEEKIKQNNKIFDYLDNKNNFFYLNIGKNKLYNKKNNNLNTLFFVGLLYKKKIVDFITIKNLYTKHEKIYANLVNIYFLNTHFFFFIFKTKISYFFYFFFLKIYITLYYLKLKKT